MLPTISTGLSQQISESVSLALKEDIASGDITAQLIPANQMATAQIITRERMCLCGQAWVNEVFNQLDPTINMTWHVTEGNLVAPDQPLCSLKGNARSLLSGERCALNFLQTLSGTATTSHGYAQLVSNTKVKLLDSRKTIPGLRLAQKYAVEVGGCHNHRLGLYDAFLIKENHIAACGSITSAISQARLQNPGKLVEVEVETLKELEEALAAKSDTIMLDNFSLQDINQAVSLTAGRAKLEVSGGVNHENLVTLAHTGVDYISIGALTKHVQAIDLSMRISIP